MKKGLAKLKTWQLLVGLLLVISGTTLFIVGVSGGFGIKKATLDDEYLHPCDKCGFSYMEIGPEEYEKLVEDKKSFVVMVDQNGCTTAERLRDEFVRKFAIDKGIKVYKMMFSDVKKTSLNNFVKYYPSVVVISKGEPIGWLRADADEDAEAYNNYEAFEKWIGKYLELPL